MSKPFNITDRQQYYDVSYETAVKSCDLFQLKYDGWWCRLVVEADGSFQMFSRSQRLLKHGTMSPELQGIYIGEWMFGTNWAQDPARAERLFLFDCWTRYTDSCLTIPYKERYKLLMMAQSIMPDWCLLISNFRTEQFPIVWKEQVDEGVFEGVVFRKSTAPVSDIVFRMKKEVFDEYLIVGVEEGEGKFAGTLGSFICKNAQGVKASVGGQAGITRDVQNAIWANPKDYIGKTIEVKGKTRFEDTGLLRHPVIVRFKD